jgi:hypothetical protein
MTFEMWFLCAVIALAVVLFVTEKVGIDVTAIFIAFVLMVSGLVTVPEGLSGFSNQAALAILSLLILNTGLEKTGVLFLATKKLVAFTGGKPWSVLLVLLPFVAILSAFYQQHGGDRAISAHADPDGQQQRHQPKQAVDADGVHLDPWRPLHDHRHKYEPAGEQHCAAVRREAVHVL